MFGKRLREPNLCLKVANVQGTVLCFPCGVLMLPGQSDKRTLWFQSFGFSRISGFSSCFFMVFLTLLHACCTLLGIFKTSPLPKCWCTGSHDGHFGFGAAKRQVPPVFFFCFSEKVKKIAALRAAIFLGWKYWYLSCF